MTTGTARGATTLERKAERELLKLVAEQPGIALGTVFAALQERGVKKIPESVVARAAVRMINDGRLVLTENRRLRPNAA
jgi:hypothetical protein